MSAHGYNAQYNRANEENMDSIKTVAPELKHMHITEMENIELMEAGETNGRALQCSFGPGGVYLRPEESNRWAYEFIVALRQKAFQH